MSLKSCDYRKVWMALVAHLTSTILDSLSQTKESVKAVLKRGTGLVIHGSDATLSQCLVTRKQSRDNTA